MSCVSPCEGPGSVRHRAQVDRVSDDLQLRNLGPHQCSPPVTDGTGDRLGSDDMAATRRQVTHHRPDEVVVDEHRDLVHRLEQQNLRLLRGIAERVPAGHLEGHVGGVDRVGLAVNERDPDVDHGVTGAHALLHLCPHSLLDAGDELAWDRAADHLVDELKAGSLWHRFNLDVADRELPVATGLLHMTPMPLGRTRRMSRAARRAAGRCRPRRRSG